MNIKSLIDSSYLARYVFLNAVDISDYAVFPRRDIQNAAPVFYFSSPRNGEPSASLLESIPPVGADRAEDIDGFLKRNGTAAFLVIKNDQLLFERYYNGYQHSSTCTSFSTVKSFVSALIGIAIADGFMRDLDDPITKYLPELTDPHWAVITVRHLLSMSSGLGYDLNGFLPWNDQPRTYYGLDLRQLASRAKRVESPGLRFHYNNFNLILLGMILERVTGGSVAEYLQDRIWKPLGMESSASWSLDSRRSGMEKMESGLNARAIDFAKFGRLYLRLGDWNGRQVIPEGWVVESTSVDPHAKWTNYKYLWWIPRAGTGRFMAIGNLGQFIYLAPDRDCIIVRFGSGKPKNWQKVYVQFFGALADAL